MKIKLNKAAMINWPRKDDKDKCDIYEFTAGEYSSNLPKDVAKYVLDNYQDKIIDVLEEKDIPKKTVEEHVSEIKAKAAIKTKEFEEKKKAEAEEKEKNKGLKLEDLAKNA